MMINLHSATRFFVLAAISSAFCQLLWTAETDGAIKQVKNEQKNNFLADEASPYLRSHADNPVNWYPWGEAAFTRAKEENKPIFLSIGYAACHWCHVMEKESFRNPVIAEILNKNFISIKVDREERPDVDRVYMNAVQAMTGSGGWPLSVFLTPELLPFYGGTYFPPESRGGLPGFANLLERISEIWEQNPTNISETAKQNLIWLKQNTTTTPAPASFSKKTVKHLVYSFADRFDQSVGGLFGAPKFPPALAMRLILRFAAEDEEARHMVELTLQKLAMGGIHDQLAGGFHRYSVDSGWAIPHFEKMLYDNALLSLVYTEAWQAFSEDFYRINAEKTLDWVLHEMRLVGGGFAASLDADSVNQEGAFYTWTWDEITAKLPTELHGIALAYFGITRFGDLEDNRNVLKISRNLDDLAQQYGIELGVVKEKIVEIERILLKARQERIAPLRDEKVLLDWNSLMISSFTQAGFAFQRQDYLDAAEAAVSFIEKNLRDAGGQLYHSWYKGKLGTKAYLNDLAFYADACLDLFEKTGKIKYFTIAENAVLKIISDFRNPEQAGFFDYPTKGNHLPVQTKTLHDEITPSGNSIALLALLRYARLSINEEILELVEKELTHTVPTMQRFPLGMMSAGLALNAFQSQQQEITVAFPNDIDLAMLPPELRKSFLPNTRIVLLSEKVTTDYPESLLWLSLQKAIDGQITYYICQDEVCLPPAFSIEKLIPTTE